MQRDTKIELNWTFLSHTMESYEVQNKTNIMHPWIIMAHTSRNCEYAVNVANFFRRPHQASIYLWWSSLRWNVDMANARPLTKFEHGLKQEQIVPVKWYEQWLRWKFSYWKSEEFLYMNNQCFSWAQQHRGDWFVVMRWARCENQLFSTKQFNLFKFANYSDVWGPRFSNSSCIFFSFY